MNRRTFLVATVGTMLQGRLGEAQGEVTQPVLSEADCPLEVIIPTALDGHRGLGVLRKPPGRGPFPPSSTCTAALQPFRLPAFGKREGRGNPSRSLRRAMSWSSPPIGVAMSIRSLPFRWTIRWRWSNSCERCRMSIAKHRRVWMQWRRRFGTRVAARTKICVVVPEEPASL